MSTHKHINIVCCVGLAGMLLITVLFMNAEGIGVQRVSAAPGYESKLFDTGMVHTIDIIMDDWDSFVENCRNEEYELCSVVIDGEAIKNVAIRGKGNTSLTQVESYGNDRYSFKIEFDHYDSSQTYHGLDKLCLNNIIQDNTYMKDYLVYQMMADMGVASPLCSFVYITVNGEDWGLYLAVESVEEAFLQRNYGKDYGELYKPDSMKMGGGRGNGKGFNMEDMEEFMSEMQEKMPGEMETPTDVPQMPGEMEVPTDMPQMPERGQRPDGGQMPDRGGFPQNGQKPETGEFPQKNQMPDGEMPWGGEVLQGGMPGGNDDVLLKYIDDNPDSYGNIFDNAKTKASESDKSRLIAALKKLSTGEDIADTVDVEKVIRYFVVHNFVLNSDSYTGSMIHNYYLYEENGQLQMLPWDYNLAFGGFEAGQDATNLINTSIDEPVSGGNVSDRPMIAWIFAKEEYTELYHQYFAEFMETYFDSGYFEEMIDVVSAMIAPYVEKDPTKFCTYEEFTKGVATLKEFCLLRAKSVCGQLDGTVTEEYPIDALDLNISDMGSMNMSMGKGFPNKR